MQTMPITPEGFAKLEAEIKDLKQVKRPEIIEAISAARALGDLSENAEYHSAKEKQREIESRIRYLEGIQSRSQIIDPKTLSGTTITFGTKVKLQDLDTDEQKIYKIVGVYEADLEKGFISNESPVALALLQKKQGDEIVVRTPAGEREYEIKEVIFE